ncbi:MAG: hypothetical protein H6978_08045 [Gammaproteobacteria bacterium]|nr:hypothetical protein [Gammaproteobacteria bacterium]
MKKAMYTLAILCLGAVVEAASAAVVNSGTSTNADLQGLEWLSLDVTAGMSREDVEASALLTTEGWRYATRSETEALINSLWGGVYNGYSPDNAPGALDFLTTWGILSTANSGYTNPKSSSFIFGESGACDASPAYSCLGTVTHFDDSPHGWLVLNVNTGLNESPYVSGMVGFFSDNVGGNFGVTDSNQLRLNVSQNAATGSLLVREASPVPLPPALSFLALGLFSLIGARRRGHSTSR